MKTKRDNSSGPWVLLIHGLAAHRSILWLLAWRLRRRGYRTAIFGYPSIWRGVKSHAARLRRFIDRFEAEHPDEPYAIIGHSMGGILVRALLDETRPTGLRQIIMLGSPNQGSHAARRLAPFLGRICPPLTELADTPDSLVRTLGDTRGIPTAIVAGSRDRVVTVDATHLPTVTEHHVVRSGHGELLFRQDVAEIVDQYLKDSLARPTNPTVQNPPTSSVLV